MGKVSVTILDEAQGIVQLNCVRLSFKCLWKPNIYQGKATGRQVAAFTFTEDEKDELRKIVQLALKMLQKVDPSISSPKEAANDRFKPYRDKNGEEFLTFRTSNDEKYPAAYVDDRGRIQRNIDPGMEDRIFYQGCRVNAKVQLKADKSKRGIDLWSNLVAIQFCEDDKRLGGMSDDQVLSGFGVVERELPSPTDSELDPAPPAGKKKSVDIDDLY